MGAAENRELVAELYRRMNDRRYDEMWELFAPDAVWGGGRFSTEEAGNIGRMKAVIVDPMPAFVDGGITFTLHALTAEGDRVAAEVESYAPVTNGKIYNNHYHMLFEIRDGKIAVVKEYADTAHAHEVFADMNIDFGDDRNER
jgi:ketosteroid isomerase-like protein